MEESGKKVESYRIWLYEEKSWNKLEVQILNWNKIRENGEWQVEKQREKDEGSSSKW